MPPNQAQYQQPQQQLPQAALQQQTGTIYSPQLSQASYGSNQVSQRQFEKHTVFRNLTHLNILIQIHNRIWPNTTNLFMCRQVQIKA